MAGSRKRINAEGDRLSRLPDDLIHKILSFVSIKQAVQTSVLSSRWRLIWTSMPHLNFSSEDIPPLPKFSRFVTRVLTSRNTQVKLSSLKLSFRGKFKHPLLKRIMKYAISHNVQQLDIAGFSNGHYIASPLPVFSSQSLQTLTLSQCTYYNSPPTWDLPALTTLNLHDVILDGNCDKFSDVLSECANLKNLTLKGWRMRGLNGLNISHPGLTSLRLEYGFKGVNVVTPQLKNLAIREWRGIHLISTPNLSYLHYEHKDDLLQLSTDELDHLEKVDICIHNPSEDKEFSLKIFVLLRQLRCVKSLTLNLELVKFFSIFAEELISHQPSPFANLKSLKIYPARVTLEDETQPKVFVSPEVKNYLLDSSPSATFTMVSHEDIRAMMNVTSARDLITEFQVLLDQWKLDDSDTNVAHMESHMATGNEQGEVGNHMARVESYWEDLNKQLEKGSKITSCTIPMLRKIEVVLAKLPTSHRDKLQAKFYGLRAEAETIMGNMIMDCMKIQSDKLEAQQNVFNSSMNLIRTSLQPFS